MLIVVYLQQRKYDIYCTKQKLFSDSIHMKLFTFDKNNGLWHDLY